MKKREPSLRYTDTQVVISTQDRTLVFERQVLCGIEWRKGDLLIYCGEKTFGIEDKNGALREDLEMRR